MIKKFICLVWGHRITYEHESVMDGELWTKTLRATYCVRCGAELVTTKSNQ